jgi:hypothetical protein
MINESPVSRWAREFRERHGTKYVTRRDNSLLFATGATMNGWEAREPPVNPYERAKLVVEFYQTWLDLLERKFSELKQRSLEGARAHGAFHESDRAQLDAIREEAAPVRQKLDEAQEELKRVTPRHLTPEFRAKAAESEMQAAEIKSKTVAEISSIKF